MINYYSQELVQLSYNGKSLSPFLNINNPNYQFRNNVSNFDHKNFITNNRAGLSGISEKLISASYFSANNIQLPNKTLFNNNINTSQTNNSNIDQVESINTNNPIIANNKQPETQVKQEEQQEMIQPIISTPKNATESFKGSTNSVYNYKGSLNNISNNTRINSGNNYNNLSNLPSNFHNQINQMTQFNQLPMFFQTFDQNNKSHSSHTEENMLNNNFNNLNNINSLTLAKMHSNPNNSSFQKCTINGNLKSLIFPNKKFNCHCEKSKCQKKYCECYANGEICDAKCNCKDCKNCGISKKTSSVSNIVYQNSSNSNNELTLREESDNKSKYFTYN